MLQSNEVAFHHRIVIVETPPKTLLYTITSHILIYKLLNIINLFAFFSSLSLFSFIHTFWDYLLNTVRSFHFVSFIFFVGYSFFTQLGRAIFATPFVLRFNFIANTRFNGKICSLRGFFLLITLTRRRKKTWKK